ncbi:hypothetical protein SEA_MARCIE_45 [Microbacterium phage Marcie]|nr:hypothetical protein SEA_MARCIE_45 [Microbacterium phage Marcie]
MSSAQVLSIIASLDGGFNGDVPGKQIDVQILSDTEAIYTLTQFVNDVPTDQVERYALTLVELPPLPVDPDEGAASTVEPVEFE